MHEARLTRDTETFGKMDPYCVLEMREKRVKTIVCQDQGKTPNWKGEMIIFDIKYIGDVIRLSCLDEDVGEDDLIGEAEIKIETMCIGSGLDEWY